MYLLRGAVISLEVFFLGYVLLSGTVAVLWRLLGKKRARLSGPVLFAIRMLPLLGATVAVAFFTLPSFLYLEPRRVEESIAGSAVWFALCGAIVLLAGCGSALWARRKTSQFAARCLEQARRMKPQAGIDAYELASTAPALFVIGVWRPKLLVSKGALELLDGKELHAAVRHEVAHVHRRDNLRKLALHFCRFPGFGSLEQHWLRAAELTADYDAACAEGTALELASALVKMARGPAQSMTPELGMTLIPERGAAVANRIERLLDWNPSPARGWGRYQWALLLSGVIGVAVNYGWALARVHELTEFLVR
jgi:Zn-dependent protease with chaperone function